MLKISGDFLSNISKKSAAATWWLDSGLVYALTAILVLPLFSLNYLDRWESIESAFIADGRMLRENWPHYLWQPLWYCGTRADYIYPPGIRTGVAILSALLHTDFAHAYHILIGLFYAFGIAAVYLWAREGSGRRSAALLAAAGVALLSPCFLVLRDVRMDSGWFVPWRLHVLMTYGEGPHISSLAVLPIVWLAAWRRFRGGGVRWLALSAAAAALVVTFNFYGATALAITFSLLAWACFLKRLDWRVWGNAALIAALAYGLTAWWLMPSYLRITTRNLHLVAPEGNFWSLPAFLGLLVIYVAASLGLRRWSRFSVYSFYVWSGFFFLATYTLGHRWFGLQLTGNSDRLLPELDLFAILCLADLARLLWSLQIGGSFRLVPRVFVLLVLLACFRPSWRYSKHVYTEFPADARWQQRVEYKTSSWLWQYFPDQRVFVSGTIRFWYNVWHDGQQADGISDQGILNPVLSTARWRILADHDPDLARHWLQALGVDILVVPGPTSQEPYQDFSKNWQVYEGRFPLLRDDGEGNRYYRIQRRATGIARIVDRARVKAASRVPLEYETAQIRDYAEAVEAAPPGGGRPERARSHWRNHDALDVDAETKAGEALLIQENYDPSWRAYVDGRTETIEPDTVGFMLLPLQPGRHLVRLVFETPFEMIAGRVLALVSFGLIGWLAIRGLRVKKGVA
jgi:hypothetical protein